MKFSYQTVPLITLNKDKSLTRPLCQNKDKTEEKNKTYENGDISCICQLQHFDPGKKCGIVIENIVDSDNSPYIGKWT